MDILGTIQMALTTVILGVIYFRMIKRERPKPIGVPQAIVPIVGGVIANRFIVVYILALRAVVNALGLSLSSDALPGAGGAFIRAVLIAALPEEVLKGLAMLLVIFLFRKKVRNVYEYILIGAAVGLGFTLIEDFDYVTDGANFLRVASMGGHLCFNMIMGMYLGRARYKKEHDQGPVALDYVMAFCIPILWHGIYDTFTAMNPAIMAAATGNMGVMEVIYIVLAFAVMIGTVVLQVMIFKKAFRDADKYCAMTFSSQELAGEVRQAQQDLDQTDENWTYQVNESQADEPHEESEGLTSTAGVLPNPVMARLFSAHAATQASQPHTYLSTARILVITAIATAFLFMMSFSQAWGERMDRLAEVSASDIFVRTYATLDERQYTPENLRGARITLFNVWSTTCPPCIGELPELEELNHMYPAGEVQVFGVLSDSVDSEGVIREDHLETARGIVAKAGVTFPTIVMDREFYAFVASTVLGTPTTYFVNSEGHVIRMVTGAKSLDGWKAEVDEVLAELG